MRIILAFLLSLAACAAGPTSTFTPAPQAGPPYALSLHSFKELISSPVEEDIEVSEAPKVTPMVEIKEFDAATAKGLIKKLQELDQKGHKEIIIRINSYGGSIHWGMEMIQAIEALKTPVTCVVDWKAYSMGAYLLESPACDKRLMTKRSTILFHEPLVQETGGNAHELRKTADQLDALADALIASTSERLKMSEEDFRKKISDRNWTMAHTAAKKANAIDGVIDPKDLPPLVEFEKPSFLQMLLGQ